MKTTRRNMLRLMTAGTASLAASVVAVRGFADPFRLMQPTRVRAVPGFIAEGEAFHDFVILPFGAAAPPATTKPSVAVPANQGNGPLGSDAFLPASEAARRFQAAVPVSGVRCYVGSAAKVGTCGIGRFANIRGSGSRGRVRCRPRRPLASCECVGAGGVGGNPFRRPAGYLEVRKGGTMRVLWQGLADELQDCLAHGVPLCRCGSFGLAGIAPGGASVTGGVHAARNPNLRRR